MLSLCKLLRCDNEEEQITCGTTVWLLNFF
jgi:hypothetical protein